MATPDARIVHSISGRTRLRTRGMKGNHEYFDELAGALTSIGGVQRVSVNSRTESVLIEHDAPIEQILKEAEQRGYLHQDTTPPESYLATIDRAIKETDVRLKVASSGKIDLETVTFVSFVAGGIYQMFNNHGLPAGVTLLRYAVELATSAGANELSRRLRVPANGQTNGGSGAAD
ncbi:MAG: HMA2 domain-containing protein [Polyangiaceae bacterium]